MNAHGAVTDADGGQSLRYVVFGGHPVHTLVRLAGWLVLTFITFHHLLVPIKVIGISMSPTYSDGSVNFVNRLSYKSAPPQRGDVVALHKDGELLLKRIIAVPGEKVSMVNGSIYINGRELEDTFADVRIPWEMEPVRLGVRDYFVIGDNRQVSVFGRIANTQILGKLMF
jgi:signal peptidase I